MCAKSVAVPSDVEGAIIDTMCSPDMTQTDGIVRIEGAHFRSELKTSIGAEEPLSYIEGDKKIAFECQRIRWDSGELVQDGVCPSEVVQVSIETPVVCAYPGALGDGINVKVVQDNFRWQKIVEIESLETLGVIPEDAEFLEISFRAFSDIALPDGVIEDRIPFGDSFIQPIRAWGIGDANSGAVGVIDGNVITKRIPVVWLKSASYPVQTDVTITYGDANVFSATETTRISTAKLDDTHFVVAYYNGSNGVARVGEVSGSEITSYGTPNNFNTGWTDFIAVAALDSTHFVVAYKDLTPEGLARIGEVSGTTITYGDPNAYVVDSIIKNSVAALDSTHFVVAYNDYSPTHDGWAIVGEVSGTTITSYGAASMFDDAASQSMCNYDVAALDSTHFVVVWFSTISHHGVARVGEVSGTTITSYGAENTYFAWNILHNTVVGLDSTHFVVGFFAYLGKADLGAVVGVVSGTTITSFGTPNIASAAGGGYPDVYAFDASKFVMVYQDGGNSNFGTAIIGSVSGDTITYTDTGVYYEASTDLYVTATLDSDHIVVAWQGDSSYGVGRVGSAEAPSTVETFADPDFVANSGVVMAVVKGFFAITSWASRRRKRT